MLRVLLFFSFCFFYCSSQVKTAFPKDFSENEKQNMNEYFDLLKNRRGLDVITDPPNFSVRTMAEWEEIDAITIAWEGFEPILTEIVRNAVGECRVIIACQNPTQVENYLESNDVVTIYDNSRMTFSTNVAIYGHV